MTDTRTFTVLELIAHLQTLPPAARVWLQDGEHEAQAVGPDNVWTYSAGEVMIDLTACAFEQPASGNPPGWQEVDTAAGDDRNAGTRPVLTFGSDEQDPRDCVQCDGTGTLGGMNDGQDCPACW